VRISLKVDYAVRAMAQLAADTGGEPVPAESIAVAQAIPPRFLLGILNELRRARLVRSQRGNEGGYALSRPAAEISLADVIRAVEGPLADVHEESLTDLAYPEPATTLREVWMAVRTSLRRVLEVVTLADLVAGRLPRPVQVMAEEYQADPRHLAMHALVTGVAGFIGSHLAEALLSDGHTVRGVDCFTPYYDPELKRRNVVGLADEPGFELVEADLRVREPRGLLAGVDTIFHFAAQPGVRLSWATGFPLYSEHNLLATQRLLEAAKATGVRRFVFASSSSVYGNAPTYPTTEDFKPRPHSPYGATKAAAEHLCGMYADNWGVPAVTLRLFSVYGPRQRPDMAINRLIAAGISGEPFTLFGTGHQLRDFTYVGDVVRAAIAAATADLAPGTVLNVAGGSSTTVNDLVDLVGDVLGASVRVVRLMGQAGDVERSGGSAERAEALLGWKPLMDLRKGVEQQAEWQLRRAGVRG